MTTYIVLKSVFIIMVICWLIFSYRFYQSEKKYPIKRIKYFYNGNSSINIKIEKTTIDSHGISIYFDIINNKNKDSYYTVVYNKDFKKFMKKSIQKVNEKDLISLLYFLYKDHPNSKQRMPNEINELYKKYWRKKKLEKIQKKKLFHFI